METERKVQYDRFTCSRMDATVNVAHTYLVLRDGISEIKRTPIRFDCDHKLECGIGTTVGPVTSFGWSKCVCPSSKR